MLTLSDFAEILEAAARKAREIDAEHRAERREWIDQSKSPLGNRRHCACVRRRIASGEPGASSIGRRHMLSPEALEAELQALATLPKKSKPANETTRQRLERRLALVGAG